MQDMRLLADDGLLGLLAPAWRAAIGVCVLVVMVVAGHRLFIRGPSRMSRALVLCGSAILGVIALGILLTIT